MANSLDDLLAHFDPSFSPWVEIGRSIGGDDLAVVLRVLGGQKPHVPSLDEFQRKLARKLRDEQIREKFRGNNYDELINAYGLCKRQLRHIIDGRPDRNN